MLKSKYTKNKELIRIIRNYEIELQRPKGLKLLDLILKAAPEQIKLTTLFVSPNIYKECNFITKYKGHEVISAPMPKSQVILTDKNNLCSQL